LTLRRPLIARALWIGSRARSNQSTGRESSRSVNSVGPLHLMAFLATERSL